MIITKFNCNSFGVGYNLLPQNNLNVIQNNVFSSPILNNIFSSPIQSQSQINICAYYYDLKINSNILSNNFTINFNKNNLLEYQLTEAYIVYKNPNLDFLYSQKYHCDCTTIQSSFESFNSSQVLSSEYVVGNNIIPNNYILSLLLVSSLLQPSEQLLSCVNSIDIVSYQ